jgi:hypothetical protein
VAYTAPSQVPYSPLQSTAASERPMPMTQFLQDTVGSASIVAAPAAGTPIVQLAAASLPQGAYAITATICFEGATVETTGNNVRLMVGTTLITPLLTPTSVGTPVSNTLILTVDGTDYVRLEAIAGAAGGTSYAGQLLATRIK